LSVLGCSSAKERALVLVTFLERQELLDLRTVDLLMVWREVKIKHEVGKLDYLEVKYDVPEHDFVVFDEVILKKNLVALFADNVDELFVKTHWWQHADRITLSTINVRILLLGVDFEFRNVLTLANGTLNCVAAQVLLEAREHLLFTKGFFAFLTDFVNLKVEQVFEDVAQL
jgi:hypothetical protein